MLIYQNVCVNLSNYLFQMTVPLLTLPNRGTARRCRCAVLLALIFIFGCYICVEMKRPFLSQYMLDLLTLPSRPRYVPHDRAQPDTRFAQGIYAGPSQEEVLENYRKLWANITKSNFSVGDILSLKSYRNRVVKTKWLLLLYVDSVVKTTWLMLL